MATPFTFAARIRSFVHALRGIVALLRSEPNAWIHSIATVVVVALGIVLGIGRGEWCWVIIAIVSVWVAEALNTAIEFLADAVSPDLHPLVGKAKDVAAGAVLIAAAGAAAIGVVVFGPYLFR
jgi:diacylglycerol kinase (ATP)